MSNFKLKRNLNKKRKRVIEIDNEEFETNLLNDVKKRSVTIIDKRIRPGQ